MAPNEAVDNILDDDDEGTLTLGGGGDASDGDEGTLTLGGGGAADADATVGSLPGTGDGTDAAPFVPAISPRPAKYDPFSIPGLPKVGETWGGYELTGVLGRGGMGIVFKAIHTALNREVALKLMLAEKTTEEQRERFLREAEASAALKHPNIVAVHDIGVHDEKLFFSMDFIDGGTTLKSVIKQYSGDVRALMPTFIKTCEAVGFAHRKGIIHRDLKPQNVMVDGELEPHIMDFGLARNIEEDKPSPDEGAFDPTKTGRRLAAARKSAQRLTRVGAVMGTPVYMPPEQAAGRIEEIDTRSDIYSLGVILFYLLTQEVPFKSKAHNELLIKIAFDEPPDPTDLNKDCPWELAPVCLKAIEKAREDRYQTAFELADDCRAWLTGHPVEAVEGGGAYHAFKLIGRNKLVFAVSTAALVIVVSLVAYLFVAAATKKRERLARESAERQERIAEVERLIGEATAHVAIGDAKRKEVAAALRVEGEAPDPEAPKRLDLALDEYGEAMGLLARAHQVALQQVAVSEATHLVDSGQKEAKRLKDEVVRRLERARVAAEERARARETAEAASAKLEGLEVGAAGSLAEVADLREAVFARRAELTSALARLAEDPEGLRSVHHGLDLVVEKLQALGQRERRFAQAERLQRLTVEARGALARAAEAGDETGSRDALREAIGALSEAMRVDPEDTTVRGLRVDAGLELGERALAGGELPLAEYAADDIRAIDPPRVEGFLERVARARDDETRYATALERAEIARAGEQFKEAAAAYQEAQLAAPGRPAAEFGLLFARAGTAFGDGRFEEALAGLGQAEAHAKSPFDQAALAEWRRRARSEIAKAAFARARAAADALRWAEAERELRRALEHDAENADAKRLLEEVAARKAVPEGMLLVSEGAFTFGPPAAVRESEPCSAFFLGQTEVTNGEYQAFVEAGGYEKERFWDPEGWAERAAWVDRDGVAGPEGWVRGGPPEGSDDRPVTGICWYEARAYARWKGPGHRLPTEREWEKAATWDPAERRRVDAPWIRRGADGQIVSTWAALWQSYFNAGKPKDAGAPALKNESGAAVHDESPSGALDMWGNARELVCLVGPDGVEHSGVRGGSFGARLEERALPWRSYTPLPTFRAHDLGFRLARNATLEDASGEVDRGEK